MQYQNIKNDTSEISPPKTKLLIKTNGVDKFNNSNSNGNIHNSNSNSHNNNGNSHNNNGNSHNDNAPQSPLDFSDMDFKNLDNDSRANIIADHLDKVPLLARLNKNDRVKLANGFKTKMFENTQSVIKQGDLGDAFYIIRSGDASVLIYNEELKQDREVAVLHPGDYFGETALLTNKRRNATIKAVGKLETLVLEKETFHTVFGKEKLKVNFGKRGAISAEKPSSSSVLPSTTPRLRARSSSLQTEKNEETRELISSAVENNVLFAALDNDQVSRIVDAMWSLEIKKGTILINQNESGDNYYVVEKGMFDIYVKRDDEEKLVATRSPGESFGELALMYNSPRSATVKARTDCKVWAIERYMFRKILIRVSEEKLDEYEKFLKDVPLLDSLLTNERRSVAKALDEMIFREGTQIVKQGEPGNTFYIIRRGEAVVYKKEKPNEIAKEVARLKAGAFFGERSLIKNEVRAATVQVVNGPMICLCLDRDAFCMLLGPLAELMSRKIDEEYDINISKLSINKDNSINANIQSPSNNKPKGSLTNIAKSELITIGVLGQGSFGRVTLVKHKNTGNTYALKCVSKAQIVNTGQQEHIMSEKTVMTMLDSRFIVKLFATYKDNKYLYFLLEVVLGGELFTVLRARTIFDEPTARFYTACVVSAIDYMHNKNIIYRDLKPENLLLDDKGYIKITDFGFAKIINDDRTYTLCGTPDYLAPEIISGAGHSKGVDWWTIGILLFEMLASYPPFYDEDPMKIYAKIMFGKIKYPKQFSQDSIDVVKGLLTLKPTKRLGIINGGVQKIYELKWFQKFDWKSLQNGTMKAPIIPHIQSKEDRSNFEIYDEPESNNDDYEDDGSGWDDCF